VPIVHKILSNPTAIWGMSVYCVEGQMALRSSTRALKNARLIQSIAPNLIPKNEPSAGFSSLVPMDILARFARP